jgi:hypothetical protein
MLDHSQAQSYASNAPAARRRRAIEGLKNVPQVFGTEAESMVFHGEPDHCAISPEAEADERACRAVFKGVIQQVPDQLAQEMRVDKNPDGRFDLDHET